MNRSGQIVLDGSGQHETLVITNQHEQQVRYIDSRGIFFPIINVLLQLEFQKICKSGEKTLSTSLGIGLPMKEIIPRLFFEILVVDWKGIYYYIW